MLARQSMGKSTFKLPFLAVVRRNGEKTEPFECPAQKMHAVVFTTLAAAGRYLKKRRVNDLELSLVFRQSLPTYIDELVEAGYRGVCINANLDHKASLAELRSLDGT